MINPLHLHLFLVPCSVFDILYLYIKAPAMGKLHDSIKPAHKEFIEKQHIFFVATAPLSAEGRINLSPKGLDCFRVLSENKVGYMDLISSGNETSAHTLENGRI